MHVIDNKLIFVGSAAERTNIATFCGLTKTRDGELIATVRLGSGKDSDDGNTAFLISQDNGQTWTKPAMPFSTTFEGKSGCLRGGYITELNDGTWLWTLCWVDRSVKGRPLYNKDTGGLCPMFPVISYSTDRGKNWSALKRLDISPVRLPAALTGPTLLLNNGTLAAQFEVQKEWNDPSPLFNISALKFSYDNGKTWPDYVEIAGRNLKDRVCWDQRIAILPDGKLINLFWTYDPLNDRDLPIHCSFSGDNGRTWTVPQDTGVIGQIACPVVLNRTEVVMLYVRRDAKKQIAARRSVDGGKTWDEKSDICIYDHFCLSEKKGDFFDAMNTWSYGHPYGIKLSDNHIAMVYYAGNSQTMGLWFCRIQTDE